MLQDDYILRQIREMVRAVMKMLFQVSASELTPDVIEDKEARQTLETLTSLADEGNIDEAENKLYEMTCDGDRQNLEIGLLFYYNLNGKDDDFLEAHNFSREEIMTMCGLKNKNHFIKAHLKPLLESGQLRMTIPDKPNSRNQKYVAVKPED